MTIRQAASLLKQHQDDVKRLSKTNVWKSLGAIAFNWSIILFLMWLSIETENPIVWAISFVVITARQHALLIIMHDAVHGRLVKGQKYNELLSNLFCSWPIFIETATYRKNHLAHHKFFSTEDDPDYVRKRAIPRLWDFPMSGWHFIKGVMADLLGNGLIFSLKAVFHLSRDSKKPTRAGDKGESSDRPVTPVAARVVYYVLLFSAITYFHLWVPVLLLWYLPFLTLFPAIFRLRSIAEHFAIEKGQGEVGLSRNINGPAWERFLLMPHNVGLHLDHHIFPSVPFYNLKKLHEILLKDPAYLAFAGEKEYKGFFGFSKGYVLFDIFHYGKPVDELLIPKAVAQT